MQKKDSVIKTLVLYAILVNYNETDAGRQLNQCAYKMPPQAILQFSRAQIKYLDDVVDFFTLSALKHCL